MERFNFTHSAIVFLLLLLVYSCKKETANFTLSGTITDETLNQKLAGATIRLYAVPIGTTDQNLISSLTIGADGHYSFTFPRDKTEKYILLVQKSGYFDLSQEVYFSELSIEHETIRNYSTTAKAWVKLNFVNTAPASLSDHLQVIKQSGKKDCAACCTNSEINLYGIVDSTMVFVNDGNTVFSYLYFVLGTSDQGLKSVVTTPFDTTELSLYY
jgi:hypothetical protein